MKRFFVLSCVICVLYGLSWANNFGSSIEGKGASITFLHTTDCDSARVYFGYDGDAGDDTSNFYFNTKMSPCFDIDSNLLMSEGVDLDSIGVHIVKLVYFETGASGTTGIIGGIWLHIDDNSWDAGTRTLTGTQTFNLTGDITGNLSGSVGSVTGAVGSVTGAVGSVTGNVGGSVASVTADVGITQAGADKVWGTTTRALTDKSNFYLAVTEHATIANMVWDGTRTNRQLTSFKWTIIDVDYDTAIHDFSNTKIFYVDSLDQTVTATCAGAGIRTIIFETLDASDSSAVADVRIQAWTGGSYYADCHTTVSGVCTLSLDDATYTVHVSDPPNDFGSPVTFIVTADSTDTLWGTIFVGSDPPSADKCNLYTTVFDAGGDSIADCVLYVSIPPAYWTVTLDTNTITPYSVADTSDVHGDIDINIWESHELTAGDATLTVKFDLLLVDPQGNTIAETFNYEMPDSVSHRIIW